MKLMELGNMKMVAPGFVKHVVLSVLMQFFFCSRLHARHPVQGVLFTHQWGSAAVLVVTQPLPDCCVPSPKCLPPAEPICTGTEPQNASEGISVAPGISVGTL